MSLSHIIALHTGLANRTKILQEGHRLILQEVQPSPNTGFNCGDFGTPYSLRAAQEAKSIGIRGINSWILETGVLYASLVRGPDAECVGTL